MTRDELEACWNDPGNWKWGVYCCKADPRAIVPKRVKWMGWTVNVARPSAVPVFLFLMAILAVPIFIVSERGGRAGAVVITVAASLAVVCLLCAWLSSRTG